MTGSVVTGNRALAARARDIADRAPGGSLERKAAGCAAVLLATSKTAAASRRGLDDWDGPPAIKRAARALLDDLTREE